MVFRGSNFGGSRDVTGMPFRSVDCSVSAKISRVNWRNIFRDEQDEEEEWEERDGTVEPEE